MLMHTLQNHEVVLTYRILHWDIYRSRGTIVECDFGREMVGLLSRVLGVCRGAVQAKFGCGCFHDRVVDHIMRALVQRAGDYTAL